MAVRIEDVSRAVKRVQHRHHRAMDERMSAELGISLVQWDALRHIDANPGASQRQLAELTFQTDQSFGALATRMTARGLIEPVPGPGRALKHRPTATGLELLARGREIASAVVTASFAPLSGEEVATLHEILMKLLEVPAAALGGVPSSRRRG